MVEVKKAKSIWKEEQKETGIKNRNVDNGNFIEVESRHINNFIQQNSPVNNELIRNASINELYNTDANGQLQIIPTSVLVKSKTKKTPPVYSLCSFSYDDTVDLEILNKNGRYKITGYDRRVYNAVGTLWLNERKIISLTEIFDIMNGYSKTNPSSKQLNAVEQSLNKLKSIKVFIDLTQEVKAHMIENKDALIEAGILKNRSDKVKRVVIGDNMLYFRVGTITSEQGKVFKSIEILREPSLLTYNLTKGTLISIPMEYIGLNDSNATEKVIAFQDYLLMRIISYKNKKMSENKIIYDTLYKDSGMDRPVLSKDFGRDRETIKKMMDEWVRKNLITGYEELKEGRSYIGIVFYIKDL